MQIYTTDHLVYIDQDIVNAVLLIMHSANYIIFIIHEAVVYVRNVRKVV